MLSRLLILSNGAPGRAKRRQRLRTALSATVAGRAALWAVTAGMQDAEAALAAWQPDPSDLLVVDGGDGTLQWALTWLLRRDPGASSLPVLCALPGGTTNMSALGLHQHSRSYGPAVQRLAGLLSSGRSHGQVHRHPVVLVEQDGLAHAGLFFGAGSIIRGIEYCHEQVYAKGIRSEWASGLAMARAVWGVLRQQPAFARPVAVRINEQPERRVLVLLATPLRRLFLGMRPFAPGPQPQGQPLHLTRIDAGARQLLPRLARLLLGAMPASGAADQDGFDLRHCAAVSLQLGGPWTLDGEIHPAQAQTLQVQASPDLRWLLL